ncbi:MAG: sugar transferase [Solidesulfovibrio sp.]|uniref:sugar transferase n=1 Tax=Solidesulfovibrio sp. TaxID=2910990 RepID=UPI0031584FE4
MFSRWPFARKTCPDPDGRLGAAAPRASGACLALRARRGAIAWLRAVDVLVSAISLLVATTVAGVEGPAAARQTSLSLDATSMLLFAVTLSATACVFPLFALYTETALFHWKPALKAMVKAATAVLLVLVAGAALLRPPLVTPAFLATYWLMSCLGGLAVRLIGRRLLFLTEAQGIVARRTLIVGTGKRAQEIARDMLDHPGHGFRFCGFVADGFEVPPPLPRPEKFALVADASGLSAYLREHVVDEVLVCLPLVALCGTVDALAAVCEEHGVAMTVVTRLFELPNPRHRPGSHGGEVVVTVSNTLADERELLVKRFLDVTVSATALLVLSPLLVAVWWLVRLSSPGPALFVQERVGLNKRLFRFYKFRTMVRDAESMQAALEAQNETNGATFKMRNDPRITPLGRLLRKTSIDELPQLYNVLRGDMSLVGPRPLPVRDVERIENDWPRRRFGVKPGITCLWQIGGRNSLPFERMMELDIEYVDTWSVAMDLRILAATVPVVLGMRGAY